MGLGHVESRACSDLLGVQLRAKALGVHTAKRNPIQIVGTWTVGTPLNSHAQGRRRRKNSSRPSDPEVLAVLTRKEALAIELMSLSVPVNQSLAHPNYGIVP